ncbi:uncharacterized protein N7479_009943 [Penicillium vulpinum]|uniref:FAD-binding domain-containing protein n=1 Tax=Penicillium vulpinum TaxID=29845 RepID=A0A1V6RYN3_9EURO|nr:uncharacterized protein N7479_009943 [Penicillium vulpinum]KAJ5951530.1 hypothetical protein N7479_009943 [Penicillium vulpinum]OQE06580.1 hypothetical protein PENVUL_c017G01981 [Penicillium vulpinum]
MATSHNPLKVIIIGAGIGGLTCAIACRHEGLDVSILEQAPKIMMVGAGIQVPPNAARVLGNFGLMDKILSRANIVESIDLRHYKSGEILTSRPGGSQVEQEFGSPWLVIHRADYQTILMEEAIRLGANLLLDSTVTSVDFDKTEVVCANGHTIKGDVVIGADGLLSRGNRLLGQESRPIETGDMAYRATFAREQLLLLGDSRIEDLCEESVVSSWIGPGRHCVFYPLNSGQQFNLVLVRPDNLPSDVRSTAGDITEMRDTFASWDEILTKMISCIETVLKWKLCHHEELETWYKQNVALLGDACHPTLPYQAQGAAMAVEDGAVLGKLLGLHSRDRPDGATEGIPRILQLYESLQKGRSTTNVNGAKANQRLYHLPDGPEQVKRDIMLKNADYKSPSSLSFVDVNYQTALLGCDCIAEAEAAFHKLKSVDV